MNYQHLFSVNQLHDAERRLLKFFNKMQREVMAISAHDKYIIAARGTGKSEGIDVCDILQNTWAMPGSLGGFLSPSYAKAWGNTLPAICHALAEWGYIEGIHYFVGRKAPKSANFKQPKRAPLRDAWGNAIHFWNGTVMVVLSFSQGMSANSMSLDWIVGPEAKFLNYNKIKSEVNPANRGNTKDFGYSPRHHAVTYTTDMPTTKMGRWILEKEKEMDKTHIDLIRYIYSEIKQNERLPEQTAHIKQKIKSLRAELNDYRRYQKPVIPTPGKKREYTVFYAEYDVFDNLEVLGEDFIWQMKRDSPALIWRTAFLNEKLLRVANCFYSALDEDKHCYIPADNCTMGDYSENYHTKPSSVRTAKRIVSNCLYDTDLDYTKPLYIAFDANAAISTCIVGQPDLNKRTLPTINELYVKTPQKIQDLAQKFCDYYAPKLGKKQVVFYFDHTFVAASATGDSYKDTIIKVLEKNGWEVTEVYIGQQPQHDWRHKEIDRAMKGDSDLLFPTFNLYNTENTRLAMEQTKCKLGKNGFEKDKSPESLPDSPEHPDEQKTHITDAWDTFFVGCNFFYTEPSSDIGGGIIFLR